MRLYYHELTAKALLVQISINRGISKPNLPNFKIMQEKSWSELPKKTFLLAAVKFGDQANFSYRPRMSSARHFKLSKLAEDNYKYISIDLTSNP